MSAWSQMFPPAPTFTPSHLPSLSGHVFLITGAASGIGRELSGTLYRAGGRVYMAGRDEQKMRAAMHSIQNEPSQHHHPTATPSSSSEQQKTSPQSPSSTSQKTSPLSPSSTSQTENTKGSLHFLFLDLSDLRTIKPAAQAFARAEPRLDVLFNNAGVSSPPVGSTTAQGHELQMGTNALGPFLLTSLLMDCLRAREGTPRRPRVVWVGSQAMEMFTPKGGMEFRKIGKERGRGEAELWEPVVHADPTKDYAASKTANFLLAGELGRRERVRGGTEGEGGAGESGAGGSVVSVAVNPGAINTDILRHYSWVSRLLVRPVCWGPWYGACTLLYAGFAEELLEEADRLGGECYVVPFGRVHPGLRRDLVEGLREEGDGGTATARRLWEWCERCTRKFA